MKLFVMDFWRDHSEHGGVIVAIAKDAEQCKQLLSAEYCEKDSWYTASTDTVEKAVSNAKTFPLAAEEKARIVKEFLT